MPFFGILEVRGAGLQNLSGYSFTVQPKPGSVSAPVHVTYSIAALKNRGYAQLTFASGPNSTVLLPVYGLYSNFSNVVSLDLQFADGSSQTLPVSIQTEAYTDPTGIYAKPLILKQRQPGTQLGFSFFAIKSALETPVILDTDGEIRWVGSGLVDSISTAFVGDGFVVGDSAAPTVHYLGLGGTVTQSPLQSPGVTTFHHNIDPGKQGLLADVTTAANLESIGMEITNDGRVLNTWDLGAILSSYMQTNGDDPSAFVRPGVDWFHMNAMTYDSRDDSVIVSSRENFLIKLDYKTGRIIWIFGDPTKYWYTFPSLRAKAITLLGGGLYPIGQHAVSIRADGTLMVFNDGFGSANQPTGAPPGETRTYSAVSAYSVDESSGTAQEVWDFDYGQTIYSMVCSSVYQAPGDSYLIDYAVADSLTHARLVGLDTNKNVIFDFQYPTLGCNTAWNSVPVPLDNLSVMN